MFKKEQFLVYVGIVLSVLGMFMPSVRTTMGNIYLYESSFLTISISLIVLLTVLGVVIKKHTFFFVAGVGQLLVVLINFLLTRRDLYVAEDFLQKSRILQGLTELISKEPFKMSISYYGFTMLLISSLMYLIYFWLSKRSAMVNV